MDLNVSRTEIPVIETSNVECSDPITGSSDIQMEMTSKVSKVSKEPESINLDAGNDVKVSVGVRNNSPSPRIRWNLRREPMEESSSRTCSQMEGKRTVGWIKEEGNGTGAELSSELSSEQEAKKEKELISIIQSNGQQLSPFRTGTDLLDAESPDGTCSLDHGILSTQSMAPPKCFQVDRTGFEKCSRTEECSRTEKCSEVNSTAVSIDFTFEVATDHGRVPSQELTEDMRTDLKSNLAAKVLNENRIESRLQRRQEEAKKRILKQTLLIVTTYAICWAPYAAMVLWHQIDEESAYRVPDFIARFFFTLAVFNSTVDPYIYGRFLSEQANRNRRAVRR